MPSTPRKEDARSAAVRNLELLESEPEAEFESIVRAAAAVCSMPICLLTLLDEHRYWFEAKAGVSELQEVSRDVDFTSRVVDHEGILEVADCTRDTHFASNPFVLGAPHIRFYAGIAVCLKDGTPAGILSVMDCKSGTLTDMQKQVITHLSQAASSALESRRLALTLAHRESPFHTLCATSAMGVFSLDTQGNCTYANQRLRDLFGLNPKDAAGAGWLQVVHPDDAEQLATSWTAAISGKLELAGEFRVLGKDACVLTLAGTLKPVFTVDDKLISFVGSVEDITERKRFQEQQHRSLAFMRQTGALAGVGGWEIDLATQTTNWSEQISHILGVSVHVKLDLQSALMFFLPADRRVVTDALNTMATGGKGMDLELQLRRTDGRTIWVRMKGEADIRDGKAFRLRGAIQDIDDLVRQRKALEHANDRFAIATESGEIGVWEWDVTSGRIDWTPKMYKLYGVAPEDMPLDIDSWIRFLHPDDLAAAQENLNVAIEGEARLDAEFRIVQPDGTVRHLRSCAYIKRGTDGQALTLLGVNWDVTPVRQLTSKLAQQHELLQVTLQSIQDAVITTDTRGKISWLNPTAEKLTAWSCSDALGKPLEAVYSVIGDESGLLLENPVVECLRVGASIEHSRDAVLVAYDDSRYGVEESAAPIRDAQQQLYGVVLVFRDVTEQRKLRKLMKHRATHDELTQVFNRSEFESRLRKTLNSLRNDTDHHALLFIDLDEFKLVNDACGHPVGDQLLRQISGLLNQALREGDTLARLGGDEFGVILHECSTEQARQVAQNICSGMDDFRFAHGMRRFRVGASIGLVPLDDRWANPAAIMQAADTSCYAAKEAGRNRVHVWCETDQSMRLRRGKMQWAARLEQSLDENRFELFAQRLSSLVENNSRLCAEVLIRLRDDNGQLILPGAFLPAAERYHLATRIDRWVLRSTISTLAEMPCLDGVERLWINLSGQSVGDSEFQRDAIQLLRESGSDICSRICLEITETAAVTNISEAADFIGQLRALNVKTALDDFGAGASSFGYLKSLPVDVLKIDGQFIGNLATDALDAAAVRCFVDVAAVAGLKTVAEFVETPDALASVKALGVDYAQGFLLHKPEPINQLLNATLQMRRKVAS